MNSIIVYPSLKEAADQASGHAQRNFLRLNVVLLSILSLTALISGWVPTCQETQRALSILIAVLMFVALGITTMLRIGKFDDRWFRCRALAENVKSAAWFFVMCPHALIASSEGDYLKEITELQKRLAPVSKEVALCDEGGPLVTDWMRETQNLALEQKLAIYRQNRVDDQLVWYFKKSKFNIAREKRWFLAIFVIEFFAVACAAFQAWKLYQVNVGGGMAALSAGFIAWMQTKRFSDLGVSYSIAANDLRHIAAERQNVTTEEDAQIFVKEVEAAVSREHSMWLARRVD
jgi:hypothetical protein